MNKIKKCCNYHSELCGGAGVNDTTYYCCDNCPSRPITSCSGVAFPMPEKDIEKIDVYREDKFNRLGMRERLSIEEQIEELQDKLNEIIERLNEKR